ncbi:hypothetical protein Ddye_011491 [Dipteronia dyeriana]|uniref:Uncharacterized protein n=1 Tax=Dipteronia dyeriana TaxID=168575 RepID=A0AAD9X2N8_9ROSI|nr:hypothetical protein Ddye_011491 [Dipteronia dyeriana]
MDKEFSDYKKIGIHFNQMMGSNSSIGTKRLTNVCVAFRAASQLQQPSRLEQQRIVAVGVRYPRQM